MIQEIINFVDTLPEEVFTNNLKPKEGLYVLLDIDENGNLLNVDKDGKINRSDIEKYLAKDEADNGLSEHLALCKSIYLNSQIMGKGTNKSFNSSLGIFSSVATPFGIGFRKRVFNAEKQTIERKTKAIEDYFNAAKRFVGERDEFQEWFRRMKLFCETKLLEFIQVNEFLLDDTKEKPNEYAIKNTEFIHLFLRSPDIADFKTVNQDYFAERIFNEAKETSKGKFGVSANTHVLNESKVFLRHITGLTPTIKWLSGQDAAKVQKFYSIQGFLPKPLPLFIYRDEREAFIKIFKENSRIKYSEIVRSLTNEGRDELHNYYLIFFGGTDYSRVVDLDFVSTFQFAMDISIKKVFQLNQDDIKSLRIKDVFDFESQIVKEILNIHSNNYIKYFDDEKFDPKYTTHHYFNQFLKYRKAFYDYIYKSKKEAISQKMFDDILLKGILDDIRTDEYNPSNGQNTNHSKILTKLNIWFSLYNYFHSCNYKKTVDMITKIERHRNVIDAIINESELLNNEDEFAYAAGQCVRYLFSKSETSDKSYNRLDTFLQKTDCRLLQSALANFFGMYKHKEFTGNFGKVFAQVMDYETDANVKEYLPEFLAGFFDKNKLFFTKKSNEEVNK